MFKAGNHVAFHGTYPLIPDSEVSLKDRVHMAAREIRVKDNKTTKTGHRTRFWCSQDAGRKKKAKLSLNPDAKHRDYLGMKRYHDH